MRHFAEQTKWLPIEEIREKNNLKRNDIWISTEYEYCV